MQREAPDILRVIVEVKRREVERLKAEAPVEQLEERISAQTPPLDFAAALSGDPVRVIAEVKKASPAKGLLRPDFDAAGLAATYVDNGAAAISVLTNTAHFQGTIEHLDAVAAIAHPRSVPLLRKEFVFDEYQVYETRACGADAILLIVAMLESTLLQELLALATDLRLQALVEVHDETELETALEVDANLIGVNNRNLRTFKTDLAVTERLAPNIPAGRVVVSESGISSREHVQRLGEAGASAVLVGEALLTAPDVGSKLRELA